MADELLTFVATALEGVATLVVIVLLFFATVYFGSGFIEARLDAMISLIKAWAIIVDVLIVPFAFGGFGILAVLVIAVSNGLWTFLLWNGFPFIAFVRPDFILALMSSVFGHFFLMLYFLGDWEKYSLFSIAAYFLLYVWSLPIMMLTSLIAVDEDDESRTGPRRGSESQKRMAQCLWNDTSPRGRYHASRGR